MKKYLILFIVVLCFLFGCQVDNNKEKLPSGEVPGEELPKDDSKDDPKDDPGENPKEEYDNVYSSELYLLDEINSYIELSSCSITKLNDDVIVQKITDEKNNVIEEAKLSDLLIGEKNLKVYCKDNKIKKIVIPEIIEFTNIRVCIRQSINDIASTETLYHDNISLEIFKDAKLVTFDENESFDLKEGLVQININNNKIKVSNDNKIFETTKRIIIKATDQEIKINNISRGGTLKYSGDLDISLKNDRLLLINEVGMEDYIKKVVPSEVFASWPLETLKAQAVAARTYAYREIYNRKFLEYGYVVDDSTSSQVYNNGKATDKTNQAVKETNGIVMFYNNEPIVAYYFSTSSGLTANGSEVWIEDSVINDIPYLTGKNLSQNSDKTMVTIDKLGIDTPSENDMLTFFKNTTYSNPSEKSNYYRWKISFSKEALKNTINANIKSMYKQYPKSFLQFENGAWVSKEFSDDIGNIQNVYVSERGISGVVVSLTIVTDKITFKIYNQYNIRFTIRPRDTKETTTLYYGAKGSCYSKQSRNPSILNSGFFALEWNGNNLTFYGGGNGHGVGLDQYGSEYYGNLGYDFKQILTTYYSNIIFKEIKNDENN